MINGSSARQNKGIGRKCNKSGANQHVNQQYATDRGCNTMYLSSQPQCFPAWQLPKIVQQPCMYEASKQLSTEATFTQSALLSTLIVNWPTLPTEFSIITGLQHSSTVRSYQPQYRTNLWQMTRFCKYSQKDCSAGFQYPCTIHSVNYHKSKSHQQFEWQ